MKHATGAMDLSQDNMCLLSRYICLNIVKDRDSSGPETRHNFPIHTDWRSFFPEGPFGLQQSRASAAEIC